jgi:argininosuccinate lyase
VTHLQAAQPVTVGYQLMAYAMPLLRDEERLAGLRSRLRYCPLGSGSLAGSPLPLNREHVAKSLGFEGGPSLNGMDSVAARDLAAETCQVAALTGVDLSRLAEDMILWASPGYGYIRLPDACCTGSSLMPQKKNPDGLELVRGKSARLLAHAVALTTLMKGLPMAYNKDLQEDKEAVFDSVDNLMDVLALTRLSVSGIEIDEEKCMSAVKAHSSMMATDLADYLVNKGLPFRSAHEVAGQIVADAEDAGVQLSEMPLDKMHARDSRFESDIYEWLDPEKSVAKRVVTGGPAPQEVARVIASLKVELAKRRAQIDSEHNGFPLYAELKKAGRL